MIELRSDNAAGVAPEILAAIEGADTGTALAYGADHVTERLTQLVREVFEHPNAQVFPVTSGTAANALAISALCPPWGAILCHETAHVLKSEAAASSLLAGGAAIQGVAGEDFRLHPPGLEEALARVRWGDPHHSQPAVLALTNPTDWGTVYRPEDIQALVVSAKSRELKTHLDGARLANALVTTDTSPGDMTWRSGVDVLSLGATKNGGLSAEAIVSFDDAASAELVYRTKRAGHVTSKMRYQSAQLIAYLTDGLWLELAERSNHAMARLARGLDKLGVELVNRPDVNMAFVRLPERVIRELEASGLLFYRSGPKLVRFVTSWQTTESDVDETIALVEAALG